MNAVRHDVIGLGCFGKYHAQMAGSMAEVELATVCTRRSVAERHCWEIRPSNL
ncbi:MAG: hypothetical protein GWP14_02355 [Actinobacteria bacterium]|nr:hypothetical protein [Actinomycetota bacterium]